MDTDKRLAEIRQRVEAATHGKWLLFAQGSVIEIQTKDRSRPIVAWLGFDNCLRELEEHRANAKFIVCAHNDDIPYLLDEIERLRAALEVFGNELNYVSTGIFGEYGPGPHCYPWLFADEKLKGVE